MQTYTNFDQTPYDFKSAMQSELSSFFDGTIKYVGEEPREIPECKIIVSHRRIETPTQLTICIVGDSAIEDETRLKISDPLDSSKRAIEVRGKIQRSLYVITPSDPSTEGNRARDIDKVWGLLYAMFATRPTQLSRHGIFYPTIPMLPTDIQSTPQYLEAYGMFRAELRTYFRPYSIGL